MYLNLGTKQSSYTVKNKNNNVGVAFNGVTLIQNFVKTGQLVKEMK
jgi:hypothetical protein